VLCGFNDVTELRNVERTVGNLDVVLRQLTVEA
jgi:hypothetical protein